MDNLFRLAGRTLSHSPSTDMRGLSDNSDPLSRDFAVDMDYDLDDLFPTPPLSGVATTRRSSITTEPGHLAGYSAAAIPVNPGDGGPGSGQPDETRARRLRFLTDFTFGFADGLVVPFALTAGLSSLGQTDLVVYGGMAEIVAGCVSMGVGGYLAAKGERDAAESEAEKGSGRADLESELRPKGGSDPAATLTDYLAPLDLPPDLQSLVLRHAYPRLDIIKANMNTTNTIADTADASATPPYASRFVPSPYVSGASVAAGYLVGGLLPLMPYFFVRDVGSGLALSFVVCVVAMFLFGFGKDLFMNRVAPDNSGGAKTVWRRIGWKGFARSLREGAFVAVLGSATALVAIFCVKLLGAHEVTDSG